MDKTIDPEVRVDLVLERLPNFIAEQMQEFRLCFGQIVGAEINFCAVASGEEDHIVDGSRFAVAA